MMATKSVEYLIAVAFLLLFIVFWRFVTPKKPHVPGRKEK